MANAYITQIELPSGTTYDLHDSRVDSINNWDYQVCTSAANTPKDVTWTSGSTTITGTLVASADTMYKIYLVPDNNGTSDIYDEYITVRTGASGSYTYTWEMFGNTKLPNMNDYVKNASGHSGGTAGALAYKSSASTSYTPAGSVSQPTFTGSSMTATGTYTPAGSVSLSNTNKTTTVSKASSGDATYTPAGSVSQPTFTGSSMTSTGTYTPTGTVTLGGSTNKTATVSATTGTATYTPGGSNASSTVSGTCTVTATGSISTGTGTANYTPGGTVGTPTISVKTAGSTTTIKNPTSKTVVTDMSVADPGAAATGELVYCSVSGTKLSLKKFIETTGASITTSNVTVKNGDAAYQSSQPTWTGTGVELKFTGSSASGTISGTAAGQTFTGTGVRLVTGNIPVYTSAEFEGDEATITVTGTPAGTVSKPTFTGTGARLVTGNISVPTSATFTGTEATISVTGTPAGTVSKPTFTGTAATITVS